MRLLFLGLEKFEYPNTRSRQPRDECDVRRELSYIEIPPWSDDGAARSSVEISGLEIFDSPAPPPTIRPGDYKRLERPAVGLAIDETEDYAILSNN